MNEFAKQFVVAAGRALWETAWSEAENLRCRFCGFDGNKQHDGASIEGAHELWLLETGQTVHHFVTRVEEDSVAPTPTPQAALLTAAYLLGKLEQLNGHPLRRIVHSAWMADGKGVGAFLVPATVLPYVAEFARSVALESSGSGQSFVDDHGDLYLPDPTTGSPCRCGEGNDSAEIHGRPEHCDPAYNGHSPDDHHPYVPKDVLFRIPQVTFTFDEVES